MTCEQWAKSLAGLSARAAEFTTVVAGAVAAFTAAGTSLPIAAAAAFLIAAASHPTASAAAAASSIATSASATVTASAKVTFPAPTSGAPRAGATDLETERASVDKWRVNRLAELTGETGWLNLAGLFWLDEGTNTFGRAAANNSFSTTLASPPTAGSFVLTGGQVRFTAAPDSGITHEGQPVTTLDLVSDAKESPTVVSSGPLRFFVIERAGKLGVRVRDVQSPRRRNFLGLDYFPIATAWALAARFEPYEPRRHIKIVNILGLEEAMESPGAVVFTKDGKEYRLDAVLDGPEADDLFIFSRTPPAATTPTAPAASSTFPSRKTARPSSTSTRHTTHLAPSTTSPPAPYRPTRTACR